jgi:hypothetical protein
MNTKRVASSINISHERRLGQNVNDGPFVVMTIDGEPYIMLTIKRNIMAAKLVDALRKDFGISKAMIGIAFNNRESALEDKLVIYPDPTCNGVYVPFSEFKGNVCQMLGQ